MADQENQAAENVARSGRPSNERDGACICDYNPDTTDGPQEDCPFHGRPYAYWIERGDALASRLNEAERLFSSYFMPDFGGYDWRGDEAVQEFARRLGRVLSERHISPDSTVGPMPWPTTCDHKRATCEEVGCPNAVSPGPVQP